MRQYIEVWGRFYIVPFVQYGKIESNGEIMTLLGKVPRFLWYILGSLLVIFIAGFILYKLSYGFILVRVSPFSANITANGLKVKSRVMVVKSSIYNLSFSKDGYLDSKKSIFVKPLGFNYLSVNLDKMSYLIDTGGEESTSGRVVGDNYIYFSQDEKAFFSQPIDQAKKTSIMPSSKGEKLPIDIPVKEGTTVDVNFSPDGQKALIHFNPDWTEDSPGANFVKLFAAVDFKTNKYVALPQIITNGQWLTNDKILYSTLDSQTIIKTIDWPSLKETEVARIDQGGSIKALSDNLIAVYGDVFGLDDPSKTNSIKIYDLGQKKYLTDVSIKGSVFDIQPNGKGPFIVSAMDEKNQTSSYLVDDKSKVSKLSFDYVIGRWQDENNFIYFQKENSKKVFSRFMLDKKRTTHLADFNDTGDSLSSLGNINFYKNLVLFSDDYKVISFETNG